MSLSFTNRAVDFIGRSVFGRENGFVRDKRLTLIFAVFGLIAIILRSEIAGLVCLAILIAVFVSDVRRYNREHPNG